MPWEFVCQYGESHLHFVSRWMEREGMYYFFEQTAVGEKLIITDTSMSHTEMPEGRTMYYSPPSGLDEPFREEIIHAMICSQKLLPGKLHVQDYNYRTPSLDLTAESPVSPQGRGEFHIYGEHFRNLQEGSSLAGIRAQELLSHEKRFHGESTIPFLRPGYLFDLERHYRRTFNQQYLTIELEHAGSQAAYLISGVQGMLSEEEKHPYYRNNFVCIPASVQYRHPKTTQKPRFYGTINARIDAEGSGKYAELDSQGRYKVKMPFDLSGRQEGKASHWLRMVQPYAGTDHGMHFPLHKGTEVLLTFVEGDPDRPIIAGAVPNPEKPSVINDEKQTMAAITTSGQNKIHFEDQEGNQRILMQSPTANSWVRIGSHNDPVTPHTVYEGDDLTTYTDSDGEWKLYESDKPVQSKKANKKSDDDKSAKYRLTKSFNVKNDNGIYKVTDFGPEAEVALKGSPPADGSAHTIDSNTWTLPQMPIINYGETGAVSFYREVTVTLNVKSDIADVQETRGSGIRIRSSDNVWIEAENRYANYMIGGPESGDIPEELQYLWDKFYTDTEPDTDPKSPAFAPTGMKLYQYGDDMVNPVNASDLDSMKKLAKKGQVKLAKGDTFNTQEGNIYDFGGYWNYNLGNSYAENHIDQSAVLNAKNEKYWPWGKDDYSYGKAGWGGVGETVASTVASSGFAFFPMMASVIPSFSVTPEGAPFVAAAVGIAAGFVWHTAWSLIGGACRFHENVGDVIEGPGSGEIKTWSNNVKSSFDTNSPMHTDTTWVEKKIGDSYDFKKGNTIEITCGDTESHTCGDTYEYVYGGYHEEHKYNSKGIQVHWEKKGGGVSKEATFDPMSGALLSFEFKNRKYVNFDFNFELPSSPKFIVSASIAPMTFKADVGIGMNFNIIAHASVDLTMDFGRNISFLFKKFKPLELEVKGDEITTNIPFFKTYFKTTLAEQETTRIKTLMTDINTGLNDIKNKSIKLENSQSNMVNSLINLIN
jgi:type VI secretion system VgrG family protein